MGSNHVKLAMQNGGHQDITTSFAQNDLRLTAARSQVISSYDWYIQMTFSVLNNGETTAE